MTVHEFTRFVKEGGYGARKFWEAGGFEEFAEPDEWEGQKRFPSRPVVGVSWFEAAAYCAWAGGRLPTEAEWERVARGPNSARYPWGDAPPLDQARANYELAIGNPTPVGVYPLGNSVEGIGDLLGNVWEWCSDWFGEYPAEPQLNPAGPQTGEGKVLRGGSWFGDPRYVRVSFRLRNEPARRVDFIGFRCAGELR